MVNDIYHFYFPDPKFLYNLVSPSERIGALQRCNSEAIGRCNEVVSLIFY